VGPTVESYRSLLQNAVRWLLRGYGLDAPRTIPTICKPISTRSFGRPRRRGPSGGQIYIDGFTGGTLAGQRTKDSIREIASIKNPFSPRIRQDRLRPHRNLHQARPDKLNGTSTANLATMSSTPEHLRSRKPRSGSRNMEAHSRPHQQDGFLLPGCFRRGRSTTKSDQTRSREIRTRFDSKHRSIGFQPRKIASDQPSDGSS